MGRSAERHRQGRRRAAAPGAAGATL